MNPLPDGVAIRTLSTHADERGDLTELFRAEWDTGIEPVQWNIVHSQAGVLRGVHVHPLHVDHLTVIEGEMLLGLKDLREESPTRDLAALVPLSAARLESVVIPNGVAHGFYSSAPCAHIYAVSHYWDTADELGCRWDDPELGIPWPETPGLISPRDEQLPGLEVLRRQLTEARAASGQAAR